MHGKVIAYEEIVRDHMLLDVDRRDQIDPAVDTDTHTHTRLKN
jgi:hypothetical protein